MNFLEAQRLLKDFKGGTALPLVLAMSGTAEPLDLYLRAAGAKRGRAVEPSFLPFNTLGQALHLPPGPDAEVFLLFPWDLVPEADWRSGVAPDAPDESLVRERAAVTLGRAASRPRARLLYVQSPALLVWSAPDRNAALEHWLAEACATEGATLLPAEAFHLAGYFTSGCPIGGAWLGPVAEAAVEKALAS